MAAAAVRHLLLQYSNDTAKLIDALLMDESLRSFQPPAAPAATAAALAPEPPAPVVDQALLASVRERFAHVEEFAAAKQVSGRGMVKESKSAAKRKVLALAARIAAEDEEEAQWDDEYDDTYDSVDVRVADGTAEEEVEAGGAGGGARKTGAATANIKRSNVGSEAMVNDPAAKFEEDLFRAWSASPGVFERSGKRLPERARLRERTGMSDQQIEGWASMLRRTPARVRHLQNRYQFAGNRTEGRSTPSAGAGDKGEQDVAEQQSSPQRNAASARRDGPQSHSSRGGNAGRGTGAGANRGRGRGGSSGSSPSADGESDSAQTGAERGRGGGQRGGRGGRDVRAERVKAHWKKTKDMA
ncbi:hypothetical protein BCR44DRAFT_1427473 [Catenaria anguillulae PL171]|uniref:CUE domain-containing protein n=1 Tax=Catenaria anguillulae PL171 TaxID=765915 RepID=A0A1Y2HXD6_9FUNG|nr:hypothetical protein BCR44DRAFT_1427473 [Catenaria anguillulae PL171]